MSKKQDIPAGKFGVYAGETTVGGMLGIGQHRQERILGDLQKEQAENGFVSKAAVKDIAEQAAVSSACVQGVASFYSMLEVRDAPTEELSTNRCAIRVCDGPSCCLSGAAQLGTRLQTISQSNRKIDVARSSCIGQCDRAPAILADNRPIGPVSVETLEEVGANVIDGLPTELRIQSGQVTTKATDYPWPTPLTRRFGVVEPRSLESARQLSAYETLRQAITLSPAEIINTVEASDLRGRGGAGFNTGRKWRMASEIESPKRFVICNADESEPGTFKDRALMENDPHLLLEGMAICAHAIGADEGVIYIRGEYDAATELMQHAISEARAAGLLGKEICGSEFSFDVHIHVGAGAYICGEETALLESLEGKRGEPRERPPFPTTAGYRGHPTVVNNVETLCAVPFVVQEGADAYRQLGLNDASGTKLFCLSGHVARPGVYEAPMGLPLREAIENLGGGVRDGGKLKFALTGGAAGTFVPKSKLDVPLCFEAWEQGIAIGSGAIIVANDTVNTASMLQWLLHFFEQESCGMCTPCRIGTRQARQIADRFAEGRGRQGDTDRLLQLAKLLGRTSFCGLGQSVAWPIESAIRHFADDFNEFGNSSLSNGEERCNG